MHKLSNCRSVYFAAFFWLITVVSFSQSEGKFNRLFTVDSLSGFDEESAKLSALSEGFVGVEFKVRVWQLKRAFVNSKYNLIKSFTPLYSNANKAATAGCVNEDFEAALPGNITSSTQINGWTITSDVNNTSGGTCNLPAILNQPAESAIIQCNTSTGYVDPVIGSCYPIYSVFGNVSNNGNSVSGNSALPQMKGSTVMRLNNFINNFSIEKLSKTINVTSANSLFQFAFISVFYPGHTCCDAGAFQLKLTNASTNTSLTCPGYSVSAPSSQCVSSNTSVTYYISGGGCPLNNTSNFNPIFNKWNINALDLSSYIGSAIVIDFIATDCTAGGHYGYVYLDAQCGSMSMNMNSVNYSLANPSITIPSCGNGSNTLTAPPNMGSYSWSSSQINLAAGMTVPSATNQVLITNQTGTVQLSMYPATACQPIVKIITLSLTPAAGPITVSGNLNVCPNTSTTLTANGASTYTWSNGSQGSNIILSPTAPTNYSVAGTDANGCPNFALFQLQTIAPTMSVTGANTVCLGSSTTYTATGALTYSLNGTPFASTVNVLPISNTNYTIAGTNSAGCTDVSVVTLSTNPACSDVWPGDANSDGIADNLDVLELGLHISQIGPLRTFTSNLWQSYQCNNWVGTITNGQNVSHADCDGDGIINSNDVVAIANNYNLIHSFKGSAIASNPQLNVVSDQTLVLNGQWGSASVYLGDNTNPISAINGVAFTIWFDTTYIETDSVNVKYPLSFINTGQNLEFVKSNFANGKLYCATSHTNNMNVNGSGKIAVFNFKVKQNLWFDTLFYYNVNTANMSDALGNITALTSGADTTKLFGLDVGIKKNGLTSFISIFPNPGNGLFNIKSSVELVKVEIEDVAGHLLLKENCRGFSHQLKMEQFAEGIFFVKIYCTDNRVERRKIVLKKN
ncbi:MAG: T9SS type A sorting domain-containing protein [Bacteroidetes bacterium]|nr:T9SS type A sorting domain-containing protein [Bacteroidota bacterium]